MDDTTRIPQIENHSWNLYHSMSCNVGADGMPWPIYIPLQSNDMKIPYTMTSP